MDDNGRRAAVAGHDCGHFDYSWLIPHWAPLHRLYHFTERRSWAYFLTWPLWFGRYHWLSRKAQA